MQRSIDGRHDGEAVLEMQAEFGQGRVVMSPVGGVKGSGKCLHAVSDCFNFKIKWTLGEGQGGLFKKVENLTALQIKRK